MSNRQVGSIVVLITVTAGLFSGLCAAAKAASEAPAKVYVPYDELKDVFEAEDQGVFRLGEGGQSELEAQYPGGRGIGGGGRLSAISAYRYRRGPDRL